MTRRGPVMDRTLAVACGLDAGNRSMKAAGRTTWSSADQRAASAELAAKLKLIPKEGT